MNQQAFSTGMGTLGKQALEYFEDACQRSVIFWDILRQRGNIYLEHLLNGQPPVLVFKYEIIVSGKSLKRPVNYDLAQIIDRRAARSGKRSRVDENREYPQARAGRQETHPKRPIVIIDPRAGHGPGIGGSKRNSEIGMALDAGHPVYFILFHTYPEPDQTLADVVNAEIAFLSEIRRRHPDTEKPAVIGNCQGGWAAALLGASRPDMVGPLVLNGSPLSYWAGVEGKNPMRYRGGLTGGAWTASLCSDLGNGLFDGANLVAGFEDLNPANTLWNKQYHLYKNVDTEAQRFLDFEKWWGGFFYMTTEEIHFIVESLFVGNRLEQGLLELDKHQKISLKNIQDPILVFASSGDNITPPQQALNWIVKVWKSAEEIKQHQQVIVYLLHETIGHLGIFVSGQVSKKEHKEIISSIDLIEYLSPGLYEMVIAPGDIPGEYRVQFEERDFTDILRLDDLLDDEDFRIVAAVSERLDACYGCHLRPLLKPWINKWSAAIIRQMHPLRMSRYLFSDLNPALLYLQPLVPVMKENRNAAAPDNPFVLLEALFSDMLSTSLNLYRDLRDQTQEFIFQSIYRNPWLEFLFSRELAAQAEGDQKRYPDEKEQFWRLHIEKGGFLEGVLRIMIAMTNADHIYEKKELSTIRNIIIGHNILTKTTEVELKRKIREQMRILQIDRDKAIAALPRLIRSPENRLTAIAVANALISDEDAPNQEGKELLGRITALLEDRKTLY